MKDLFAYLHDNEPRFVEGLREYLRFPSVSAQPKHAADLLHCARWLADHCKKIGLESSVHPTQGHPVVIARTPRPKGGGRRPHFLVYGHYDVQPPEPFDLWETPAFEPRVENGNVYARGACDNKGQHWAHLAAVEAYLKTGTPLPCDLTFIIEGEEEVGSPSLPAFLRKNRAALKSDGIVISDTGLLSLKHPTLTYALRGIYALELKIIGPSRDLHSGIFGGTIENPAMALAQLLAKLRDDNGKITIPGFYKEVAPLSRYEKKALASHPFNAESYRKFLGVPQLFGEKGHTPIEQRSARPTLEINGLTSGYQGEGSKTIIPSWASVKITMRLVPNQTPEKLRKIVPPFLRKICSPAVRLEIHEGHGAQPYLLSPQGGQVQAGLAALEKAFGHKPVLLREGGSIPIVNVFKQILGADALLLGLSLPDDNIHSPNEKFSLRAFAAGARMSAYLWRELRPKAKTGEA